MSVRCVSAVGMCADSGRMHADNVQEVRRQRSESAQTTFRKETQRDPGTPVTNLFCCQQNFLLGRF